MSRPKRVPDLWMDLRGEYCGDAYPSQQDVRLHIRMLEGTEDEPRFAWRAENSSGGVIAEDGFDYEIADGINRVATTDHSLGVYEDDWKFPEGMDRAAFWDLSVGAGTDWSIRLDQGQIIEVSDWLDYALGVKTWDWEEQGEEWV